MTWAIVHGKRGGGKSLLQLRQFVEQLGKDAAEAQTNIRISPVQGINKTKKPSRHGGRKETNT